MKISNCPVRALKKYLKYSNFKGLRGHRRRLFIPVIGHTLLSMWSHPVWKVWSSIPGGAPYAALKHHKSAVEVLDSRLLTVHSMFQGLQIMLLGTHSTTILRPDRWLATWRSFPLFPSLLKFLCSWLMLEGEICYLFSIASCSLVSRSYISRSRTCSVNLSICFWKKLMSLAKWLRILWLLNTRRPVWTTTDRVILMAMTVGVRGVSRFG